MTKKLWKLTSEYSLKSKDINPCYLCTVVQSLSCVLLSATSWTATYQAPLSMRLPRHGKSGLPFPSPEDLPDPGTEPTSPTLAGGFFTTESPGKSTFVLLKYLYSYGKRLNWYLYNKRGNMKYVLKKTKTIKQNNLKLWFNYIRINSKERSVNSFSISSQKVRLKTT